MVDDPGFAIEDRVFSDSECDALSRLLTRDPELHRRAGVRHLMANATVAALASDERLLTISRRRLGAGAVPFRATLFEKSGRANWLVAWHQDRTLPLETPFESPDWGPWSRKAGVLCANAPAWALARVLALRVHLDASTIENGPLRVIPGLHRLGVLSENAILEIAKATAAEECLVRRGGVLAMRPLLIHASSKALAPRPRRVLHIEYADAIELRPGIRLAVV